MVMSLNIVGKSQKPATHMDLVILPLEAELLTSHYKQYNYRDLQ